MMTDQDPPAEATQSEPTSASCPPVPWAGMVRNLAEPMKLAGLNICGFAAGPAKPDGSVEVITRAALTSDQPEFFPIAESTSELLVHHALMANSHINVERYTSVLLVVHIDQTADLYLDTAAIASKAVVKRGMKAGEVVFVSDIADIRGISFPAVSFAPGDKVLYCFRIGWKFGLFFDLAEGRDLDIAAMERDLGYLYRTLRYQYLYDALGDEAAFRRLVAAGWFPFVEVIGPNFKRLLQANRAGIDLASEEFRILDQFTDERVDSIATRWFRLAIFERRRQVLKSGVDAFKRKDAVACLKILLTEIEGIVRDAHIAELGASAKIHDLLDFAIAQGVKKTEGEVTLFFPLQFARYLRDFIFANFDPMNPSGVHASRHAVGHGAAGATAYTQVKALQTLLTIDQLAFFL